MLYRICFTAFMDIVNKIKELLENEARSCSMDFGCITPLYVYRMLGGAEPFEEIEKALTYLRANNYDYRPKTAESGFYPGQRVAKAKDEL